MSEYRDGLVRALTAFVSWAEMVGAMSAGYVPTLLASRGGRCRHLAAMVRAEGYRVYDGVRVA